MPPRLHRPSVQLPADLARDLSQLAKTNGNNTTALIYSWVIAAARLASAGHGELLPQQIRAPRGTVGRTVTVRWTQDTAEFHRCREIIEAAGSSVPAVLRTAAQAYIAAGGDAVGMNWPPKSELVEAA